MKLLMAVIVGLNVLASVFAEGGSFFSDSQISVVTSAGELSVQSETPCSMPHDATSCALVHCHSGHCAVLGESRVELPIEIANVVAGFSSDLHGSDYILEILKPPIS